MPLNNLLDNQFECMLQMHQPLSEIENMPYWKLESMIERLNRRNDELASQRKKQDEANQKAQQNNTSGSKINTSSLMNKMRSPKF